MKKINIELRNIYRSEESQPDPEVKQSGPSEAEEEARRRFIFSLVVAILATGIVIFIASNLVKIYLVKPDSKARLDYKVAHLTAATLPDEEQWAIDYRHIARQAENLTSGKQEFSAKWLKNVAYHVIMGEEASRINDLDSARYHLERANITFPDMKGIQRNLGTVYLKLEEYVLAEKFLQQAYAETPSVELLNNIGIAYVGLKDYVRAEETFKQAIQQQPDLAACYKNVSLMYQKKGSVQDAMVAMESYLLRQPDDTLFLQLGVDYLTENGKNNEVIRILKSLQGADPWTVHILLAKAAAREKDESLTIVSLKQAAAFKNPRELLAEMNELVFKSVSKTASFEALAYELELAVVSDTTNQMRSVDFPSP